MLTDHRDSTIQTPVAYLVATDKFLSGWGCAQGQPSYVAYAVYADTPHTLVNNCEKWLHNRSDFIRVRYNLNIPRRGETSLYDIPQHLHR